MIKQKALVLAVAAVLAMPLAACGNSGTSTTTDTKTTDTKGSSKTFDAGIALYVGMALTSAAGVAFVGKKRED